MYSYLAWQSKYLKKASDSAQIIFFILKYIYLSIIYYT